MITEKALKYLAVSTLAGAALLLATTAFAGDPPKASQPSTIDNILPTNRCAIAAASPSPQGTQQIHVCNNWTASAGANVELFNTTGQSCSITAGTTAWPFAQSAPLTIADGAGQWVTLLTTLNGGATYNYYVSCCPQPSAPHTVTVNG
jgi:hypothetical protein